MRAAAHEVRRAHHRRDAARVRRFGRRVRRRKLGERDALPRRLLDVLDHRVVMTRDGHAERAAARDDRAPVRVRVALLLVGQLGDRRRRLLVGPLAMPFLIVAPLLRILPLPLPRRMVHHRREPQARMARERIEHVDDVLRRDLAAQVQEVLGAQQPVRREARERVRALRLHVAPAHADVQPRADRERVEHRRDACRRDLRVVRDERRIDVPVHARPRREMLLQVVGMQLDEPGQQIVAAPIVGVARGGGAAPPRWHFNI